MSASIEIGICAAPAVPPGSPFLAASRIPHADGITLAALDGRRNSLPSNGGFDDVVHVPHRQSVTGRCLALYCEVEEVTACRAFRKCAARARKIAQRLFNLNTDVLNC